jgi:hypothetical protein
MGRLFVLGGSPLTNEVWSANVTNATGNRGSGTADSALNAGASFARSPRSEVGRLPP